MSGPSVTYVTSRTIEDAVRAVEPEVRSYCRSRTGTLRDPARSVEEAVQDTLLALAAALERGDVEPGRHVAYACGIAKNKIVDLYRAAGRLRTRGFEEFDAEPVDDRADPAAAAERAWSAALAHELIATLPEKQRIVLWMRLIERRSAAEVAELLGTTPGAVRVMQHRSLQRLREELGGMPPW